MNHDSVRENVPQVGRYISITIFFETQLLRLLNVSAAIGSLHHEFLHD